MSISRIYTSDTNLFNTRSQHSTPVNAESRGSGAKVENGQKNKNLLKKSLYFGVGLAVILSSIVLLGRKFFKNIQKLFNEAQNSRITAVSIPDNKPIDVDVVDPRFLRKNSKLRMKPEIEDVEFTEIE